MFRLRRNRQVCLDGSTPSFRKRNRKTSRDCALSKRTVEDAGPYKILTNKSGYSRSHVSAVPKPSRCFDFVETVKFVLMAKRHHFGQAQNRQTCEIVRILRQQRSHRTMEFRPPRTKSAQSPGVLRGRAPKRVVFGSVSLSRDKEMNITPIYGIISFRIPHFFRFPP